MVPFSKANNIGTDQTAHLRSLRCAVWSAPLLFACSKVYFSNIKFNEYDIPGSVARGYVTGYWSAIES